MWRWFSIMIFFHHRCDTLPFWSMFTKKRSASRKKKIFYSHYCYIKYEMHGGSQRDWIDNVPLWFLLWQQKQKIRVGDFFLKLPWGNMVLVLGAPNLLMKPLLHVLTRQFPQCTRKCCLSPSSERWLSQVKFCAQWRKQMNEKDQDFGHTISLKKENLTTKYISVVFN